MTNNNNELNNDSFGDIKLFSTYDTAIDLEKSNAQAWFDSGDMSHIVLKDGQDLMYFYFKRLSYKEMLSVRSDKTTGEDEKAINLFAKQLIKIEQGGKTISKEEMMKSRSLKNEEEFIQFSVDVLGIHTLVELGGRVAIESSLGKKNKSCLVSLVG